MKVEIKITKKDLRRIFCAAMRHYYRDLKSRVDEEDSDGVWYSQIIDNLCEIRGACDTISHLCELIEEVDTVDNDAVGKIVFDPSDDDKEEQK